MLNCFDRVNRQHVRHADIGRDFRRLNFMIHGITTLSRKKCDETIGPGNIDVVVHDHVVAH